MKKYSFLLLIAAVLIFSAMAAGAQAKTVTDGNFRITYNDPLFMVTNAAPGQAYSSDMTVENLGGADRKFQFELDIKTNPKALAERLFLKIGSLDEVGAFFCEYGCGKNEKLEDLDGDEFTVKTIPGNATKNFRFILTFDPTAGNEFQNTNMSFDLKLGFKDEVVDDGGGGGTAAGGGAAAAPGAIAGIAGFVAMGTGTIAGEEVVGEVPFGGVKGEEAAPGKVEGAEVSVCQGWPKWVWVLMLLAYFAAFLWRTFENIKKQIEKRNIRWKWQAVLAAVAFLIWYFFDKCREFRWFVILAMIGGAVIYSVYLYFFKKNIQKKNDKIDSGSGQIPPSK